MSQQESMFDKLMLGMRKFLIPIFFLILGGIFVYFAFSEREGVYNKKIDDNIEVVSVKNFSEMGADREPGPNQGMVIGAVFCLVAALFSILFVTGKINKTVGAILAVICVPAIAFVCYKLWDSIESQQELAQTRDLYKKEIKYRLSDIRSAQEIYFKEHGAYLKGMEELVDFIKTGKITSVNKFGSVPVRKLTVDENNFLYPGENRAIDNNMSENEALRLAKSDFCPTDLQGFSRDTVQKSVLETFFMTDAKIEFRKNNSEFPDFVADSLLYIPYTGGDKFVQEFDTVTENNVKKTVMKIEVLHPFLERFDDTLRIGSLTKPDLSGNWEQ